MQHPSLNRISYVVMFVAGIIALVLFWPTGLYFLNDDLIHIPLSEKGIFGQRNSVRIFNDLSIYVDNLLYHKSATGYHASNLLWHVASCVSLYFLIRQLQRKVIMPAINGYAILASILFFCYPFHSESIFWIIGRGSTISALFLMIAFTAYLKKNENFFAGLVSIIAFTIALLTYESVWCFFIILFFIAHRLVKTKQSTLQKEMGWSAGWLFCFVVFLIYRGQTTGSIYGQYEWNSVEGNIVTGMAGNLARLLFRSFALPMGNSNAFVALSIFLIATFILAVWNTYKKQKVFSALILALVACYIISLIPYLSLGIDTHGTESERYLYLPSVFICLLISLIIINFKQSISQISITAVVFAYFTIALAMSSNNYRIASAIVANTYKVLQQSDKKYAIFNNVPGDYKGAVMLRLGLEEGWAWLKEKPRPDSIIIHNYGNNDRLFKATDIRRIPASGSISNDVMIVDYDALGIRVSE